MTQTFYPKDLSLFLSTIFSNNSSTIIDTHIHMLLYLHDYRVGSWSRHSTGLQWQSRTSGLRTEIGSFPLVPHSQSLTHFLEKDPRIKIKFTTEGADGLSIFCRAIEWKGTSFPSLKKQSFKKTLKIIESKNLKTLNKLCWATKPFQKLIPEKKSMSTWNEKTNIYLPV